MDGRRQALDLAKAFVGEYHLRSTLIDVPSVINIGDQFFEQCVFEHERSGAPFRADPHSTSTCSSRNFTSDGPVGSRMDYM
jgi:hypothetical protein